MKPQTQEEKDLEEILNRLEFARNRTNQKELTKEKRLQILNECYDGALFWLKSAVIAAAPKGTGAATLVLERSRLEMIELQRAGSTKEYKFTVKFEDEPNEPCKKSSSESETQSSTDSNTST